VSGEGSRPFDRRERASKQSRQYHPTALPPGGLLLRVAGWRSFACVTEEEREREREREEERREDPVSE